MFFYAIIHLWFAIEKAKDDLNYQYKFALIDKTLVTIWITIMHIPMHLLFVYLLVGFIRYKNKMNRST
jgi:hypothetical protein